MFRLEEYLHRESEKCVCLMNKCESYLYVAFKFPVKRRQNGHSAFILLIRFVVACFVARRSGFYSRVFVLWTEWQWDRMTVRRGSHCQSQFSPVCNTAEACHLGKDSVPGIGRSFTPPQDKKYALSHVSE